MKNYMIFWACLLLLTALNITANAQLLEVDSTFNIGTGFDGAVYGVDVQNDGKIIAVGDFEHFNNHLSPKIARLNTDGSFDNTFVSPIPALANNPTYTILTKVVIAPNGQILVAGNGIVEIDTLILGVPLYANFARIDLNGSLDMTFTQNAFNATYIAVGIPPGRADFVLQSDGTIFYDINDIGIFKLYNNGTAALTACPGPFMYGNAFVGAPSKMMLTDDLHLCFFGQFDSLAADNGLHYFRHDEAFFSNGLCFANYTHSVDTAVYATLRIDNGHFLIGGSFSLYDNQTANQAAKIDNNGNFDNSFLLSTRLSSSKVNALELFQNKILMGANNASYSGTPLNNISMFNPDGNYDATNSGYLDANGAVYAIKADTTNKVVYCSGDFLSFNNLSYPRLAKLKVNPAVGIKDVQSEKGQLRVSKEGASYLITPASCSLKELRIYDLQGRIAYSKMQIAENETVQIALPGGFYIVKGLANNGHILIDKMGF